MAMQTLTSARILLRLFRESIRKSHGVLLLKLLQLSSKNWNFSRNILLLFAMNVQLIFLMQGFFVILVGLSSLEI
jgi:hypothetical protein